MNIQDYFAKQVDNFNKLNPEEQKKARELHKTSGNQINKSPSIRKYEKMARGILTQEGKEWPTAKRGRPMVLKPYAFGGAVYTNVALSLFHWKDGSTKYCKSSFTDDNPLAVFTCDLPTNKRKSKTVTKSAKKLKGSTYANWSSDSKVIAVEAWLTKLDRIKMSPTDVNAKKYFGATVKFLQVKSSVFKDLHHSNLRDWANNYTDNGCSIGCLRTDKRFGNHTVGRARIVPENLQLEIDKYVLTLIASEAKTNAAIMRPLILKFIREFNDGEYAGLIVGCAAAADDGEIYEDDDEGSEEIKFKCSIQWIRNMLHRLNQSGRVITSIVL